MLNTIQGDLHKEAMTGLTRQARQALVDKDYEFLISVAEELQALDDCDSEYGYNYEVAQQWAHLANQE